MSETLRTLLFNAQGTREMSFRADFESVSGVHIVTEVTDWESLRELLRDPAIDLIVVGLDDPDDIGFDIVQRIQHLRPGCAIIGVSEKTDPNSIIRAMRSGCGQYVCMPIDEEDLRNALSRIKATREVTIQQSKRICIIGSSGGAGATMLSCNLAMELAHLTHHRCALVDLNLEFGDVACAFDCTPPYSIADVCREGVQVDNAILAKALHDHPSNVSILARPNLVTEAREVTPDGVQTMFSVMGAMFPYIVVDLPRAFDFISATAISPADHILIVTQLSVPFLRNASRIHKCVLDMGAAEERIDVVLNRVKSTFERISPDDVENHFGRPPIAMIPNDYNRVQSALDFGHPIVTDAPDTPARLAIQKLARRMTGETVDVAPAQGIFNRLLTRAGERFSGKAAAKAAP